MPRIILLLNVLAAGVLLGIWLLMFYPRISYGGEPRETIYLDDDWCYRHCLELAEWYRLVPDEDLRYVLTVIYTYEPGWRPLARETVRKETRIEWADLPDNYLGVYRPGKNLILIDTSQRSDLVDLAGILAHEVAHSAWPDPVQEEFSAESVSDTRVMSEAWADYWGAEVEDTVRALQD